jgi:tetratricopeptide (TPR) repeat protein
MKITKRQLKQIIKEELSKAMGEDPDEKLEALKAFADDLRALQKKDTLAAQKKIYKMAKNIAEKIKSIDPDSVKEIRYLWRDRDISGIIGQAIEYFAQDLGLDPDELYDMPGMEDIF